MVTMRKEDLFPVYRRVKARDVMTPMDIPASLTPLTLGEVGGRYVGVAEDLMEAMLELPGEDGAVARRLRSIMDEAERHLPGCPKFDVTNVAAEYFMRDEPMHLTDFPTLAPPFPYFWTEWSHLDAAGAYQRRGLHYCGMFGTGVQWDELDRESQEGIEEFMAGAIAETAGLGWTAPKPAWILTCALFAWVEGDECAAGPTSRIAIMLDEHGVPVHLKGERPEDTRIALRYESIMDMDPATMYLGLAPHLFALSLLHCSNVDVHDRTAYIQRRKQKAAGGFAKKGHGKAPIRYHVLRVQPNKKAVHVPIGEQGSGRTVARHLVRGHFKDYRQGPGLGRHGVKKLIWFNPHVRGDSRVGTVLKDYREEA